MHFDKLVLTLQHKARQQCENGKDMVNDMKRMVELRLAIANAVHFHKHLCVLYE